MLSYLRLFNGEKKEVLQAHKVEEEAKRCVILAIKVPTAINFEEVLELNAVKNLKDVNISIYA